MKTIKVGVCGATGYSGIELIKLIDRHPFVEIKYLTSESGADKTVEETVPGLVNHHHRKYKSIEDDSIYKDVDAVFFCLPHQPSAVSAKRFLDSGIKVIDLSAAYRIKDKDVFEDHYSFTHPYPELLEQAVYGLSEIYGEQICDAKLVANPGCYPTSVLLPLIPLLKEGVIDQTDFIADSKSGFSGRGKKIDRDGLFVEMNENMYAYGLNKHRHTPEMVQELNNASGKDISLMFSPQVIPIDRGIYSTIYIKSDTNRKKEILDYLSRFYEKSAFVKILPNMLPKLKWVAHTNEVHIGADYNPSAEYLIIVSAIDNLVKGASGQALQNLNLMFGFAEKEGLV